MEDYKMKVLKKKKEVLEALLLEVADGVARQEVDIDYYAALQIHATDKKEIGDMVIKHSDRVAQKAKGDVLLRAIEEKLKQYDGEIDQAKN